jgi:hypothetical protein
MKTANFTAELTPDGQITVPPNIVVRVPSGASVQVVLQWGTSDDDATWRAVGRRRFEAAYDAYDSVYESLARDVHAE